MRLPAVLSPLETVLIYRYADITPELTVYRYSEDKVIEYLQTKVSRLSKHAVAEKSRTLIRNLAKDGLMDDGKENLLERKCPVSQTTARRYPSLTLCRAVLAVGRLRMACNLVSQYVTRDVYTALIAKYEYVCLKRSSCPSIYLNHCSFTPLDAQIKTLKDQEIAITLAGAQKKKPRAADGVEDDGKKRKAKSKASQGVEKLKKANVSGMAKISSFFKK